jgi:hypothetical protein
MALCFTTSYVVHLWEFVYNFSAVDNTYQLSATLVTFSQLQLVSSVIRHSAVSFTATCISV